MTEELKPEVIKKTQESLGKFIKKPVLTEKLLMKPPFRFLHDICTAAMRETGFFEGVLSPTDCKADTIKDKDGKIAFLQKVISAVEAANGGVKLAIKPSKVVAGHEPARTNEFLQALAKALEKQTGKSNVSNTKSETNETKTTKTKSSSKKVAEKDESSTLKNKTSSTKLSKPTEEAKAKSEKISPRSKEKAKEITPRKKRESSVDKPDPEEDKPKRREKSKLKATQQTPSQESPEVIGEEKANKAVVKDEEPAVDQAEGKRPVSAKPGHRKSASVVAVPEETVASASVVSAQSPIPKEEVQPEIPKTESVKPVPEAPPKRPDSSFIRLNRQNSTSGPGISGYTSKEEAIEDPSPVSRPLTGVRPTTGRPVSARPAAPRIRDRGEIVVHEDVVKQNMGNVQIITDKNEINEGDEDENVVVVEPENDILNDELDKTDELNLKGEENIVNGEHGLLVEQILETQKELDQSRQQIMDNKTTGRTEIEWKSGRNREATDREVKKLRICIQTLTRSANPLGKLLSFLQEDVDIMQKELNNWKEMNANLDQEIDQERSLIDQSVEPLKVHLKEIQQSIDQQLEQMIVVKANILRNEQKIYKLLTEIK